MQTDENRRPGQGTAASNAHQCTEYIAREQELARRLAGYELSVWDQARLVAELLHDADKRCPVKGCAWIGKCPVHSQRYPSGFGATRALMSHPSTGRPSYRVVK